MIPFSSVPAIYEQMDQQAYSKHRTQQRAAHPPSALICSLFSSTPHATALPTLSLHSSNSTLPHPLSYSNYFDNYVCQSATRSAARACSMGCLCGTFECELHFGGARGTGTREDDRSPRAFPADVRPVRMPAFFAMW